MPQPVQHLAAEIKPDARGLLVLPAVEAGEALLEDPGQILGPDADAAVGDDQGVPVAVDADPAPSGVYFTALDSSCSMTKHSHFSSVSTLFPVSWKSREIFFRMKSRAYFRTDCRSRASKSHSRKT